MSEDAYRELLEKALSQLPPAAIRKERFEVPKPETAVSGNRTILFNMKEISDRLNRKRKHLLKYFSGELATAGTIDGTHAVFQGKFGNRAIEQLLKRYVNEFVLCPICHQPDTKIVRKDRYHRLVCEACGAASSLRGV